MVAGDRQDSFPDDAAKDFADADSSSSRQLVQSDLTAGDEGV